MLRQLTRSWHRRKVTAGRFASIRSLRQDYCNSSMKVAILGAASATGTSLSLFLKQSRLIDELSLYDTKSTRPIASDLNCIDTSCKIEAGDSSEESLNRTLENAKIVMIVGDPYPRGECVSPTEILKTNAEILSDLLPSVIKYTPGALVGVLMNPVNSLVPLALEMYKAAGIFEHAPRLFGVITADCVRANSFVARAVSAQPECTLVPVIGGGCSDTCIPIFSRVALCGDLSQEQIAELTERIRATDKGQPETTRKDSSFCFARAFAGARFCMSLCKALCHKKGVVECAYVRSCIIPDVTYFASPLELGPNGIQKYLGLPPLSDYECRLLERALPALKEAIAKGEALALGPKRSSSEICPSF